MEKLQNILTTSRTVKTLQFKQKWLNEGFVQVSNHILRDKTVSYRTRFLYILLMSRIFNKDCCYPGLKTLGKEMEINPRSVQRLLNELKEKNWIDVKRRGLNKTNLYFLLRH